VISCDICIANWRCGLIASMRLQAGESMYEFWDTHLTFEKSWLARLNYVHQNAVKHGLVALANRYPWCSAPWFESNARSGFVKSVYSFKTDQIKVPDDF
jgi:putative transposase